MQVVVNGLLTNYTEHGSGKTVVVALHGWADSAKTFDFLAGELLIASKNYKVVAIDLPGFGGTQAPSEAWDLPDYAAFVAAFVQKTGYKPEAYIGHSNGGAIAIHGLATGKLQSKSVILIGSAGIRTQSAKKTALRLLSKPAKAAIKVAPKSTQKNIRQKLYSAIGSDYLVAEHMQETFKKVVAYDVQAEAAQVSIPAVLVYGQNDTATPPAYGEVLSAQIAGSQLHVLPEAGHFVHQEQAHTVARICHQTLEAL